MENLCLSICLSISDCTFTLFTLFICSLFTAVRNEQADREEKFFHHVYKQGEHFFPVCLLISDSGQIWKSKQGKKKEF